MLDRKLFPNSLFRETDALERAKRLWPSEFDDGVLCFRSVERGDREFGHVLERNPTDLIFAFAVDSGCFIGNVKAQRWTQPNFSEESRLQNRVGYSALFQMFFGVALRRLKRKLDINGRKRDENETFNAGRLRRIDYV